MTTFNPANFQVAGFVDVGGMSHADRKRLAQNDDEGYGTPEARLGTLAHAAMAKVVAQPSAHIANWVMHLEQAAARFNVRRDAFAAGKGSTCLDIASKLEHFGDFASDKQKDFAYKLIGWSAGYNQPHPMEPKVQPAIAQAPAAPVAAPQPAPAVVTLPKLFALMQRLAKLTIGKLVIARKNQDSLCWVKLAGRDGVVGKIEGGTLSLFWGRMQGSQAAEVLDALLLIERDPEAAAVLHGKVSGKCAICNRDLTDPQSIERGIGPICLEKF